MADSIKKARQCPVCKSTHLRQEIVEDFLSDDRHNEFRCQNCNYEWSEAATA